MTYRDQQRWAAQLRALPDTFRAALQGVDDRALRRQPTEGEWSAIEVLGHMIDKMREWSGRVERVVVEDRPALPGYDQDALVRDRDYHGAEVEVLLTRLAAACERFAAIVEHLRDEALGREGVQGEYGPFTIRQCIEAPLESVPAHLAQLKAALASDAR